MKLLLYCTKAKPYLLKSELYNKDVSNIIGDFLSRYRDIEYMASLSIDEFEDWECPISPWGSDV